MSWNDVPDATRVQLLEKKDKGVDLSLDALTFQMPVTTLQRRLREYKVQAAFRDALYAGNVPIPESPRPQIEPFRTCLNIRKASDFDMILHRYLSFRCPKLANKVL